PFGRRVLCRARSDDRRCRGRRGWPGWSGDAATPRRERPTRSRLRRYPPRVHGGHRRAPRERRSGRASKTCRRDGQHATPVAGGPTNRTWRSWIATMGSWRGTCARGGRARESRCGPWVRSCCWLLVGGGVARQTPGRERVDGRPGAGARLAGAELVGGKQVLTRGLPEPGRPHRELGVAGRRGLVAEVAAPREGQRRRRDHARRAGAAHAAPDGARELAALDAPEGRGGGPVGREGVALGGGREAEPCRQARLATGRSTPRRLHRAGPPSERAVGPALMPCARLRRLLHTRAELVGREHLDARHARACSVAGPQGHPALLNLKLNLT